ncbi:glycogen synthase GlgA [Bacillus salitolerans]|uniref:Glycogen synthase n=1 Tax=Bacillus salitolerans TaxID=1437434 RepID=A0ABW4LWG6_9BACI
MNILFVVSECVPFVKTGGLADVAGSLPIELKQYGANVSVILPKYSRIPRQFVESMNHQNSFTVRVGWREQFVGIDMLELGGITYYFIDNEYYFKRDTLYGHFDDGERFSYFSHAVISFISQLEVKPDIVHCHDWHTAMIPFLIKEVFHFEIRTVFTIHNLHFQGLFPKEILHDLLNIDDSYFTAGSLEFYGMVNFMKAGILASDYITTVSPTYCHEIQTPYFGEKLDGLLRERRESFYGILNGIDYEEYDPAQDPAIPYLYDQYNLMYKEKNKRVLQSHFHLNEDTSVPIIAMITRLTRQKGIELVQHIFQELMQFNVQFIVLGSGDTEYEQFFEKMSHMYPNQVRTYIGFDETLARLIYAGSDMFLMPSKFEPCGLGQLIAMRYGTIPIVRETGGLNDTVTSYNEGEGTGNGFSFTNFNAHDMLYTIHRAISFYHNKDIWLSLMQNAMSEDNSSGRSAFMYNQLYSKLIIPVRGEGYVPKQGAV